MRKTRPPLLCMCLLGIAALANAQPVVTPTPDGPEEIEQARGYTVSNSFEVGYRFSQVSGNQDVYRSSVNFGNGMRLFEGELRLHSLDGKGKLLDELSFHSIGAGDDPYQANILRLEKNGLYRYDMQFRVVHYFNRLPSLWQGEHAVNSTRTFQNHDLILFPSSRFEVLLGYDRYEQDGPGFSSEAINQNFGGLNKNNFLRLTTDLRRQSNQYRAGFNARVAGLAITFIQAFDNYKEDTRYGDGSELPAIVTSIQPVDRLQRDEPIHGNTPITTVAIRTENEHRLGFQGRYVYAAGNRNFTLAQDLVANNAAGTLPTSRQTFVVGKARRDQGSGDFTVTFLPSDRWTISNTTAINNTRINGDAAFVEATVFVNQFVEFDELAIRHISNATEVNFRPISKLGLYGAYRYSNRRITTRQFFEFPGGNFVGPLVEQTNGINSGVAGFRWQPVRELRISFDAEAGNADLPFTPISTKKFHAETARVQWRKNGFVIGGSFKSRENNNSASLINHSSTSRSYGFNGSWTPATGRFGIDANYTRLDIDTASGIFNFFANDPSSAPARNFYTSNLHTFFFAARAQPHKRLTVYAGYNIAKDTGSDRGILAYVPGANAPYPTFSRDGADFYNAFPLTYQSPLARLAVSLHEKLSWNLGWQFYDYAEKVVANQNYHAHVGYSSLRWSF